jgi:hypothetical protein
MGKNSKSPRPQGQIKKFIGPYQITWTFVDDQLEESDASHSLLEEDVAIYGSEKTYLSYFIIPPGSDGTDILLERIAYWQNKQ